MSKLVTTVKAKEGKGVSYQLEKPLEETILYDKPTPQIARISFNRPEKHNAWFFPEMDHWFKTLIDRAVDDDEVKVIIIRGNGPSFCTGDDLNRAPAEAFGLQPGQKLDQASRLLGFKKIYDFWRDIIYCPKNTIAAVQGFAMGVGYVFVELADLCIAAESAKFSHAEQRIGFGGMTYFLTLLQLGPKRAREFYLSGETLTAKQAHDLGLVNRVVPDDKLEEETLRWAKMVALNSADGLMNSKLLMQTMYEAMGLGAAYNAAAVAHTVFTNLVWHEGEQNFLKLRNEVGTREAFRQREKRYADLGFPGPLDV